MLQIRPALGGTVPVQHGVGEVLDVERDAVAEGDHEQDWPKERESEPDQVTPELYGLAARIGPQPA